MQFIGFRNTLSTSLLLIASVTAANAQKPRPRASAPSISANILLRIMRAEDERGAGRHLGEVFDEDGAFGPQVVDDVGVVHDLVAHVQRRPVLGERALDDLDRAVDAGAERARRREE